MHAIEASAPGKMLLLGEYAVLEGAPALVMAVPRRARVRLDARLDHGCRFRADALGILDAEARLDPRQGLAWANADEGHRMQLVTQLLRGLAPLQLLPDHGFDARLDSSEFFEADGGQKLGFGSSAALTVALASAIALLAGRGAATANRRVWLEKLLRLHRDFQGGRGSGADLAASLVGGLISYRLRGEGDAGLPEYRSARLAPPLRLLFVWTGRAAVTAGFLARLEAWREAQPAAYDQHMTRLRGIAEAASDACCRLPADAPALMAAARDYSAALADFGDASGLEVFTDEHRALQRLGEREGFVYKPCGAGGGDFGVAFCAGGTQEARAMQAIRTAGFVPQRLAIETQGLMLHPQTRAEEHPQRQSA